MKWNPWRAVAGLVLMAAVAGGAASAEAHEDGKAEEIIKNGEILHASKTNNEHVFTVIYNERIWACTVKTIGNWVGEGVGGAVCYSNGVDAEEFETLDHEPHDD